MGDEQPRLRACDGLLPILRHSSAASEPREGALDDPSARDNFEALRGVGAFDDLHCPASDFLQCALQFGSRITTIGEDITQQRVGDRDGFQQVRRPVPILDIGAVNGKTDQQSEGIGDDMAVSTGRRNTSMLRFLQHFVHSLCGCLPAERFARSAVQRSRDSLKITGTMLAEICALREVLPQ